MRIRAFAAVLCLAVAGLVAPGSTAPAEETRLRVRVEAPDASRVKAALESDGYDVLRVSPDESSVELVVSRVEWQRLVAGGYQVVILDRTRPLREALRLGALTGIVDSDLLITANVGASPTYFDLNELLARMQQIASTYPAIAQVVDITASYNAPPTFEGRHLFALKISDNVSLDEDEPAMLVVSAHHAREISTPLISLNAADRLTAGYNIDPRITSAVNNNEIWIAPVWNPDGYNHVFAVDNLWRKNRRVFSNGVGVDQNRNYPQGWTASCSGSTSVGSETYKGPAAASEAETQTMMIWSRAERFAKVIDYHSYGREVLYSYLCQNHPFTSWMQEEARALSQASGYGGLTRLPSGEGEHQQWQFSTMGAYAFLIETHTEFQPSFDSAVSEASLVWPGILAVLDRPISISGHVTDAVTGMPVAATVEILNVTFANGESNSSGGPFGEYHVFLPPGTYDLRFSSAGFSPATRRITVTATSASVVDVQLAGAPPPPPQKLRIVK
jgi:hypothetical protein